MPRNVYDQAGRYLARLDAVGLLCWLLGLPASAFSFEGWLDTRRLPFPGEADRTCDTVAFLRDLARGGVPWAVVLEFQLAPDPLMFGRLLQYLGLLWVEVKPDPLPGDRFAVAALVVNLTGKGDCGRQVLWPEAGLGASLVSPDRSLSTYQAREVLEGIAAGAVTRAALGLIPLMQGGGEDATIRRWVEVVSPEQDSARRTDHAGLALVFAEAAGCAPAWKEALKGWNMIQSKQVQEWQDMARKEAHLLAVLDALEARFGPVPADLRESLSAVENPDALRQAHRLAVRASSLDTFRAALGLWALLRTRFGALPDALVSAIAASPDVNEVQRWATLAGQAPSLEQFRTDARL